MRLSRSPSCLARRSLPTMPPSDVGEKLVENYVYNAMNANTFLYSGWTNSLLVLNWCSYNMEVPN